MLFITKTNPNKPKNPNQTKPKLMDNALPVIHSGPVPNTGKQHLIILDHTFAAQC